VRFYHARDVEVKSFVRNKDKNLSGFVLLTAAVSLKYFADPVIADWLGPDVMSILRYLS
jgi:hypothetical protein